MDPTGPGPAHIHGITPARLRGAPRFEDIEATVAEMLSGRVLVAHNIPCGSGEPSPLHPSPLPAASEGWHDAEDDVRVLLDILHSLLDRARPVGTQLPLAACVHDELTVWQPTAPRLTSPWADPGKWLPPAPLVQGAKFAVTGDTPWEPGRSR